jgi:CRISPR-associated protein Cmr6
MFYPYSKKLQEAAKSFDKGNFSLWFNKLIPLNNEKRCKACNEKNDDKEAVEYYERKYNRLINNRTLKKLLKERHRSQRELCKLYEKAGYEIIDFNAVLESPLITGIGQSHPIETGMVFDHTMGIPYIPASSLKGIVRFAHMLELIKSDNLPNYINSDINGEYIVESNLITLIPTIFGGDADKEKEQQNKTIKLKGKVVFLDAYPDEVPDLYVDIINPHYSQYYSDIESKIAPADYLEPTPIKFLTIKAGTKFTFRALVARENTILIKPIKIAFKKALEEEAVGAKSAVGYGSFKVLKQNKSENLSKSEKSAEANDNPVKKMLNKLKLLKNNEIGRIQAEIVNNMENELKTIEEKIEIARAIKEKVDANKFRKINKNKKQYLTKILDQSNKV